MLAIHLLIVAGDADLRHRLTRAFEHEGFLVQAAGDAASALSRLDVTPDGLIIEVDLPDADGRDLRETLRVLGVDAPVLFLMGPASSADPRAGAGSTPDDHLTKPIRIDEAVGRLRALLHQSPAAAPITFRSLRLDPVLHAVRGEIGATSLTPTEFRVLATLAERGGVVIRRGELVRSAWPEGVAVSDNSLDQYIARLRDKLRAVTARTAIVTTRGVGYRLE
jgi:DNA-binding response OmpR family regulator